MIGRKARARFKELSNLGKVGVVSGAWISLILVGGAVAGTPTITYGEQRVTEAVPFTTTLQDDDTMLTTDPHKLLTPGIEGSQIVTYKITYEDGKESAREAANKEVTKQPVAEVKARGTKEIITETATEAIPFGNRNVNDSTQSKGTSKVTTAGVNGEMSVTYQITKIKGQEVARARVSEQVTKAAVDQVTAVGTKVAKAAPKQSSSNCDPNYSGACVPIASDVDCGGGSGNGPAYLYGTARVVGSDIYDLDRDNDGLACE